MTLAVLLYFGERALWFGDGVLVKGAALLAATALVVRLGARASASTRHLVWMLGLAGVLLLSAGAWLLPGWTVDAPSWLPVSPEGAALGGAARTVFVAAPGGGAPLADLSLAAPAPSRWAIALALWPLALGTAWGLGALALLLRLALDLRAAAGLARRAQRVRSGRALDLLRTIGAGWGLTRLPELRQSPEIDGPATVGWIRPVILAPLHLEEWTEPQLRGVLAHELAHARRHDCLSQLLARVVCALHWPNPLAWWVARRLLAEREMAADDAALRAGSAASDYAGLLLHLVEAARSTRAPVLRAALPMTGGSALGERVARLLDPRRSRTGVSRRLASFAAVGSMAVALSLGCLGASGWADNPPGRERASAPPSGAAAVPREKLWMAIAQTDGPLSRRLVDAVNRRGAGLDGIDLSVETWQVPATGQTFEQTALEGPLAPLRSLVDEVEAGSPPGTEKTVLDGLPGGRARTVVLDLTRRFDPNRPELSLEYDELRRPLIVMRFNPTDAGKIARLTGDNVGRRLGVLVGADRLLSAPMIQSPISERGRITFGAETADSPDPEAQARALAAALGVTGGPVEYPDQVVLSAAEAARLMIGEPRIHSAIPLAPGETRWALFRICVDTAGQVDDVERLSGSAPEEGRPFVSAARGWRYRPHQKDGAPVPFCYLLRVQGQQLH